MREFFAMGGYGAYVWSCYALAFVVLLGNFIAARRGLKRQQELAKRRTQAAEASS